MQDASKKGRTNKELPAVAGDQHWTRRRPELVKRGEKSGAARFSDAEVDAILAAYQTKEKIVDIAKRFGVSRSYIHRLVSGNFRVKDPTAKRNMSYKWSSDQD